MKPKTNPASEKTRDEAAWISPTKTYTSGSIEEYLQSSMIAKTKNTADHANNTNSTNTSDLGTANFSSLSSTSPMPAPEQSKTGVSSSTSTAAKNTPAPKTPFTADDFKKLYDQPDDKIEYEQVRNVFLSHHYRIFTELDGLKILLDSIQNHRNFFAKKLIGILGETLNSDQRKSLGLQYIFNTAVASGNTRCTSLLFHRYIQKENCELDFQAAIDFAKKNRVKPHALLALLNWMASYEIKEKYGTKIKEEDSSLAYTLEDELKKRPNIEPLGSNLFAGTPYTYHSRTSFAKGSIFVAKFTQCNPNPGELSIGIKEPGDDPIIPFMKIKKTFKGPISSQIIMDDSDFLRFRAKVTIGEPAFDQCKGPLDQDGFIHCSIQDKWDDNPNTNTFIHHNGNRVEAIQTKIEQHAESLKHDKNQLAEDAWRDWFFKRDALRYATMLGLEDWVQEALNAGLLTKGSLAFASDPNIIQLFMNAQAAIEEEDLKWAVYSVKDRGNKGFIALKYLLAQPSLTQTVFEQGFIALIKLTERNPWLRTEISTFVSIHEKPSESELIEILQLFVDRLNASANEYNRVEKFAIAHQLRLRLLSEAQDRGYHQLMMAILTKLKIDLNPKSLTPSQDEGESYTHSRSYDSPNNLFRPSWNNETLVSRPPVFQLAQDLTNGSQALQSIQDKMTLFLQSCTHSIATWSNKIAKPFSGFLQTLQENPEPLLDPLSEFTESVLEKLDSFRRQLPEELRSLRKLHKHILNQFIKNKNHSSQDSLPKDDDVSEHTSDDKVTDSNKALTKTKEYDRFYDSPEELLIFCASYVNPDPTQRKSPKDRAESVLYYLQKNVDPNYEAIGYRQGTALMLADEVETVDVLIKGKADPNKISRDGRTAILTASNPGKLNALLNANANPCYVSPRGEMVWDHAIQNRDMVKILIDQHVPINPILSTSQNPLKRAVLDLDKKDGMSLEHRLEVIELLLQAKCTEASTLEEGFIELLSQLEIGTPILRLMDAFLHCREHNQSFSIDVRGGSKLLNPFNGSFLAALLTRCLYQNSEKVNEILPQLIMKLIHAGASDNIRDYTNHSPLSFLVENIEHMSLETPERMTDLVATTQDFDKNGDIVFEFVHAQPILLSIINALLSSKTMLPETIQHAYEKISKISAHELRIKLQALFRPYMASVSISNNKQDIKSLGEAQIILTPQSIQDTKLTQDKARYKMPEPFTFYLSDFSHYSYLVHLLPARFLTFRMQYPDKNTSTRMVFINYYLLFLNQLYEFMRPLNFYELISQLITGHSQLLEGKKRQYREEFRLAQTDRYQYIPDQAINTDQIQLNLGDLYYFFIDTAIVRNKFNRFRDFTLFSDFFMETISTLSKDLLKNRTKAYRNDFTEKQKENLQMAATDIEMLLKRKNALKKPLSKADSQHLFKALNIILLNSTFERNYEQEREVERRAVKEKEDFEKKQTDDLKKKDADLKQRALYTKIQLAQEAIAKDDYERFCTSAKELIDSGDINKSDASGINLFHFARIRKAWRPFVFLEKNGANLDACMDSNDPNTSVRNMAKRLVKAEPEQRKLYDDAHEAYKKEREAEAFRVQREGERREAYHALSVMSELSEIKLAAERDDVDTLKRLVPNFLTKALLQNNPYYNLNTFYQEHQRSAYTVMHFAAQKGALNALRYLENQGGQMDLKSRTSGFSKQPCMSSWDILQKNGHYAKYKILSGKEDQLLKEIKAEKESKLEKIAEAAIDSAIVFAQMEVATETNKQIEDKALAAAIAKAKIEAEAQTKAIAAAKAKEEALARPQADAEVAKLKAETEAKAFAIAKAAAEAEAKAKAELKAKEEAVAQEKVLQETRFEVIKSVLNEIIDQIEFQSDGEDPGMTLIAQNDARAKAEADAAAQVKAEAELKAQMDAEEAAAKAKEENERLAKLQAEAAAAKAKAEADAAAVKAAEENAKALAQASAKTKAEAELKAKRDLEEAAAKAEAELKAKMDVETNAKKPLSVLLDGTQTTLNQEALKLHLKNNQNNLNMHEIYSAIQKFETDPNKNFFWKILNDFTERNQTSNPQTAAAKTISTDTAGASASPKTTPPQKMFLSAAANFVSRPLSATPPSAAPKQRQGMQSSSTKPKAKNPYSISPRLLQLSQPLGANTASAAATTTTTASVATRHSTTPIRNSRSSTSAKKINR